ncbi:MAG: 4Fe-4S binding protein [Oscillospiraceae bacterium]|nr:4Fe-4S binding protein [Oscillospiraceae bacterium]
MKNTETSQKKSSLGQWISNHRPTKRRIIQLYAALLANANLKGFKSGWIYMGNAKYACTPGLNCYSCPAASASCPLGALQNALRDSNKTIPFYIIGILMLYGFLFGRFICGFLCPFGLIQDLLHKIKTPKIKKNRLTRTASYFKYVLLAYLVISLPLTYAVQNYPLPGFCKYICPSGILLGAVGLLSNEFNHDLFRSLGPLFTWKFLLLVIFIVGAVFIYRFFCRFFCPLGALYGLFNKISWLGVKMDNSKCTNCGLCVGTCDMDIRHVGDHECISCGKCVNVCPTNAISYKGPKILLAPNETGTPLKAKQNIDPCDAPGTPLPKKTKIVRLIVAITMFAVLGGALVYYNFIHKDPERVTGGEVGNICPEIEMTVYDTNNAPYHGNTISPSDTRGKVTVINFWYIYCGGCVTELQEEFPLLHDKYGDRIEVIVVHSNQEFGSNIPEWINANLSTDSGFIFTRDIENEKFFRDLGGTSAWPITIILDEFGVIQYKVKGNTTFDAMSEVIDNLLNG